MMTRIEFANLAALAACVATLSTQERGRITAEAAPTHALLVPDELADRIHQAKAEADPAAVARSELVAYAADRRWRVENAGIVVGDIPVATDDRSKLMIMGARVAAAADPEWATVWHGADGGTYPLNAAAMIAISNAVEAHVNATFATFAATKSAIDAGEVTTSAEVDAAFA